MKPVNQTTGSRLAAKEGLTEFKDLDSRYVTSERISNEAELRLQSSLRGVEIKYCVFLQCNISTFTSVIPRVVSPKRRRKSGLLFLSLSCLVFIQFLLPQCFCSLLISLSAFVCLCAYMWKLAVGRPWTHTLNVRTNT